VAEVSANVIRPTRTLLSLTAVWLAIGPAVHTGLVGVASLVLALVAGPLVAFLRAPNPVERRHLRSSRVDEAPAEEPEPDAGRPVRHKGDHFVFVGFGLLLGEHVARRSHVETRICSATGDAGRGCPSVERTSSVPARFGLHAHRGAQVCGLLQRLGGNRRSRLPFVAGGLRWVTTWRGCGR
jgi:hypothetical protein